jgi:hypothetical protein
LNLTQQILDATPKGASGRGFVGNAIDQTSRLFKVDGQFISKGSAIKYVDKFNGSDSGMEYSRVWTKDNPYLLMGDTMKQGGNIRKFSASVLDSPYNLNIAPQNGAYNFDGSTNMQKSGDGFRAKKYMLSLENLAWRASNRYGFRYEDLPYCERGPNGGRIMWFAPYDVKVSESNSSRWTDNQFLGRIEPVYTYQGAERTGTLSFKIVVDHPSILNLLVRKRFSGMSDAEVNNYIQAFFVGAKTEDLYELARTYTTLDKNDLERVLAYLNQGQPTQEIYTLYHQTVPQVSEQTVVDTGGLSASRYSPNLYFSDGSTSFLATDDASFDAYVDSLRTACDSAGLSAEQKNNEVSEITSAFLKAATDRTALDKLVEEIRANLKQGNSVVVNIDGGQAQNETGVSAGRITAVRRYLTTQLSINDSGADSLSVPFTLPDGTQGNTQITFVGGDMGSNFHNVLGEDCTSPDILTKAHGNAALMATMSNNFYCRSVRAYASYTLRNILADKAQEKTAGAPLTTTETLTIQRPAVPSLDEVKRILMKVLSEQYYFDALQEDSPLVYTSLKEKLKVFHPAFHSTTPEGLNSRLTFLIQCTRPGDTIPVVQADGQRVVEGARNTTFGPPPVCVLRVGDFYHSKVLVRDVNISFEENLWDLNPEGIGLQPLIAEVNISLTFIGGQGLEGPVSELQNALSSNFFANTEMYDDRATATEDRSSFNKVFLQQLVDATVGLKKGEGTTGPQAAYGNPIGQYRAQDTSASGTSSGVLDYTALVSDTFSALSDYAKAVTSYYNQLQKNWGATITSFALGRQNRQRTTGQFLGASFPLLGVPGSWGSQPDTVVANISNGLKNMDFGVFPQIKNQLTTAQFAAYQQAYSDQFEGGLEEGLNAGIRADQKSGEAALAAAQNRLTAFIDKVNLVNTGVDGVVNQEGVREFSLSGATPLLAGFFTPYLGGFTEFINSVQTHLTQGAADTLQEDPAERVPLLVTYMTPSVLSQYLALFSGVSEGKLKKIRDLLQGYLQIKPVTLTPLAALNAPAGTVSFTYTENLSKPNKDIITKVFSTTDQSNGTDYNYLK